MCTVLLFANTMQTVNTQEPRVGFSAVLWIVVMGPQQWNMSHDSVSSSFCTISE